MHSLADADYHKSDCVFRFKVPGYKDINREMRDLSVEIDSRRRAMTSPDREFFLQSAACRCNTICSLHETVFKFILFYVGVAGVYNPDIFQGKSCLDID